MKTLASCRCGALAGLALAAGLAGCATDIAPQDHTIAPSPVPLASFESFVLRPLAVEHMQGDSADHAALQQIEIELRGCVRAALRGLREEPEVNGAGGRTLVVAPVVVDLKKVNRTERRWVGPFAGSSAVLLRLELRDAAAQAPVAAPVFHASGDAWRGSFAPFAASDDAMLQEVVDEACGYVTDNLGVRVAAP